MKSIGILLLTLDIVVILASQGVFRDGEEACGIGNIREANEPGGLFEESFGGMSTRNDSGIMRRKKAFAAFAGELGGADNQFDGLGANREILDVSGFVTTVNGVTNALAVRTNRDFVDGDHGEANGIFGRIPAFMNDSKLGKAQRFGPKSQAVLLVHFQLPLAGSNGTQSPYPPVYWNDQKLAKSANLAESQIDPVPAIL